MIWDEDFDNLFREYVRLEPPHESIPSDTSLIMLGVDSTTLLQLMMRLEQLYDVRFPTEMLTEEVFRTAGSVWTAVTELRRRAAR